MEQSKQNIVIFPSIAQGHEIPFLSLALHLEGTNKYTITLINNPLNIKKLRSSLPQNSSIQVLEIPFNSVDHDLPPFTENTDAIPDYLCPEFLLATSSFKPHFRKLMSDLIHQQDGHKPLCIISNMFFGWCQEIAQNTVCLMLCLLEEGVVLPLHVSTLCGSTYLPHWKTDSDEFVLPDFPEASTIHISKMTEFLRGTDGSDSVSVFLKKVLLLWTNGVGILVNTVDELDNVGLMYFRRKLARPIWPIGPVLLSRESQA